MAESGGARDAAAGEALPPSALDSIPMETMFGSSAAAASPIQNSATTLTSASAADTPPDSTEDDRASVMIAAVWATQFNSDRTSPEAAGVTEVEGGRSGSGRGAAG